jgi:hypothetical protein
MRMGATYRRTRAWIATAIAMLIVVVTNGCGGGGSTTTEVGTAPRAAHTITEVRRELSPRVRAAKKKLAPPRDVAERLRHAESSEAAEIAAARRRAARGRREAEAKGDR